jgi:Tol biopolymer transport system component
VPVATGVSEAAVSPDGRTIALVVSQGDESRIDLYDVDLRTRSRLVTAKGVIDQLDWAPDGSALAYRLSGTDPRARRIEVRGLTGAGDTTTLARGQVSSPQWQSDGRHVFFQGIVDSPLGPVAKVFRRGLTDQGSTALTLSAGIPARTDLNLQSFTVSPDGRQIAFVVASGGHTAVWVMNSDGTGVAQLAGYDSSSFPYSAASLNWTPQ